MTIVETVTALVLFAMFITGACRVIVIQRQIMDKARDHYIAANIAKNQLEQIRNALDTGGYEQIFSMDEDRVSVDEKGDRYDNGKFRRTTAIRAVDADLAEAVITVELLDRVKMEFDGENAHLRSFIARPNDA